MADFRVENRKAVDYIALPVYTSMADLPARVSVAFSELDAYLVQMGIESTGGSLIRYRSVSFDAPFTVEVAYPVASQPRVRDRYVADRLESGTYAVAEQRAPYSTIGELTGELLEWGKKGGLDFAVEQGASAGAESWQCWYENYVDDPVEGRLGLEGTVQVCILLRD